MTRRVLSALLCALCLLTLPGCWDYRGLDELTIVAGITVDRSPNDPTRFLLTFEMVNTTASTASDTMQSELLESEGVTISEAISNASKQQHSDLHFANTDLLVVSHQIAEQDGLDEILETLLRTPGVRGNLVVAISHGTTAKEVLSGPRESGSLISYDISGAIRDKRHPLNATRVYELFKISNSLSIGIDHLALPAYRSEDTGEKAHPVSDGLAVFEGARMLGWLPDSEMPFFLLTVEPVYIGSYVFAPPGGAKNVTLQMDETRQKLGFSQEGNALTLTLDLTVTCSARTLPPWVDELTAEALTELQTQAAQSLERDLQNMFRRVQTNLGVDLFGWGLTIYGQNPGLWQQIGSDWNTHFRAAQFLPRVTVTIQRTGPIRAY